jgi:hypothetical protein
MKHKQTNGEYLNTLTIGDSAKYVVSEYMLRLNRWRINTVHDLLLFKYWLDEARREGEE